MASEGVRVMPISAAEALDDMESCIRVCRAYQRAGERCAEYNPDILKGWRQAFAHLYAQAATADVIEGER